MKYILANLCVLTGEYIEDKVDFVNNGMIHLFDCIGYKMNERNIERYSYPRMAMTIKCTLKYSEHYSQGTQFKWFNDLPTIIIKNVGK